MTALMVAGFALQTVGAISQRNYAKAAADQQQRQARLERDAAMESARKTRESAEASIGKLQDDVIQAGETQKSDLERRADKERSELLAVAGDRGQMSSSSFWRQMTDLQFVTEIDKSRVNQGVNDRVDSLQADKLQIVQDQADVNSQAGLNYYQAASDAKLQRSFADARAFMQIAQAGISGGQRYRQGQMLQEIASNKE